MLIRRFFWWCAGSDEAVLKNCPMSDQIKHAGYGTLVLVPAVLAFISMSFAISTLTPNQNRVWVIAMAWATIVFIFDRFIISSFRKGGSVARDALSGTFLSRLIFAALVGFIVAHPLVMFVFNDSVRSRLDERQLMDILGINSSFDQQIAPFRNEIKTYDAELTRYKTDSGKQLDDWQNKLITVMAQRRSRRRVGEIRRRIQSLTSDQNATISKMETPKKGPVDHIADLEQQRKTRLANYRQARDYLAREVALSDLVTSNGMVRWTQRLLIFLFVFVDILPITFKVMTKKEAYDFLVESSHKSAIDGAKQEDTVRTTLLDSVTAYQKEKLEEIIKARRADPEVAKILSNDVDEILKRSVIRRRIWREEDRVPVDVSKPATSKVEHVRRKATWPGRFRERAREKSVDFVIGLACIPLQALVAFAWFVFRGEDVIKYVSPSTLAQVFPLFIMNFGLSALFKRTTNSGD